jgi:hypothetical protein
MTNNLPLLAVLAHVLIVLLSRKWMCICFFNQVDWMVDLVIISNKLICNNIGIIKDFLSEINIYFHNLRNTSSS